MLLVRILFFGSDFPLIKQGSAPVKIQKREKFSLLFVQKVDKVLNFRYNKGGKDRKLHKLCRRYAVCFRYFCDVSYPQLRESYFNFSIPLTYRKNTPFGGWSRSGWRVCFLLFYIYFVSSGEKYEQYVRLGKKRS